LLKKYFVKSKLLGGIFAVVVNKSAFIGISVNAYDSVATTVFELTYTLFNCVQLWKALAPMKVTVAGIFILANKAQLWKALVPMEVTLLGITNKLDVLPIAYCIIDLNVLTLLIIV
jgi:hypothetical protein